MIWLDGHIERYVHDAFYSGSLPEQIIHYEVTAREKKHHGSRLILEKYQIQQKLLHSVSNKKRVDLGGLWSEGDLIVLVNNKTVTSFTFGRNIKKEKVDFYLSKKSAKNLPPSICKLT